MSGNDFYEDDNELWKKISSDVVPLKNKKPRRISKEASAATSKKISVDPRITNITPSPRPFNISTSHENLEAGDMSRVDGSVAGKLKDGTYPIDARLDLHGLTQDEAFESLRYFVETAYSMGKRCVLIITGKGVSGRGVLREQFPKWLTISALRDYILAFVNAKPQHGGDGAFYVLLRKKR